MFACSEIRGLRKLNSISLSTVIVSVFLIMTFAGPLAEGREAPEGKREALRIWAEAFCRLNGINATEFKKRIDIAESSLTETETSRWLWVLYHVKFGEFKIKCSDTVTIFLSSKEDAWRHIPIPRDVTLNAQQVLLAAEKGVGNSSINKCDLNQYPRFASEKEAKKYISDKTEITHFVNFEPVLWVPGKLPRNDGQPYAVFSGVKGVASTGMNVPEQVKPKPVDSIPVQGELEDLENAAASPEEMQEIFCAPEEEEKQLMSRAAGPTSFAPEGHPADSAGADRGIKGWLNLITGAIESWEDSFINYAAPAVNGQVPIDIEDCDGRGVVGPGSKKADPYDGKPIDTIDWDSRGEFPQRLLNDKEEAGD